MSVLYIRDKDGSFTPVPALQGEDGGYYVPHIDADGNLSWTASEVDMPSVEPVNIKGKDGKSGVHVDNKEPTDPSVNVWIDPDGEPDGEIPEPYVLPVASADTLGGVKVGEGLTMDGEKLMVTEPEAVLIDTIEVQEEVTTIDVNKEPDGTPYKFSYLVIRAKFPPSAKTGNMSTYAMLNYPAELRNYMINPYNASTIRNGYSRFYLTNKRWRGGWWTCVASAGDTAAIYYENPIEMERLGENDGYIKKIRLFHVNGIEVGSTFEIWGVRA